MRALVLVAIALVACDSEKPVADHPGKVVFQQQCALCHSTDGSRMQGPTLAGVLDRPAASVPGFNYTKALRESGLTWDAATLNAFLENPVTKVPGSMMVNSVKDPTQRAAVIEYLRTLKAP